MLSWFAVLLVLLCTSCSQQFTQGRIVERGLGRLHLGVFFTAASTPSQLGALPGDDGNEVLGVIRPFSTNDGINRRFSAYGLNEFLQLSLGVGVQWPTTQGFEVLGKEPHGKLMSGVAARI